MLGLTKLWGDFRRVPINKDRLVVTKRLFLQRLSDPDKKEEPLYLTMNTLSGSIDVLNYQEGKLLESLTDREVVDIPKEFLIQLRDAGYLFPSEDLETLTYDMIIKHHKELVALNDKILPFFALDTTCHMGCSYCFQKRWLEQTEYGNQTLECSTMDKESLRSAFEALDFIQDLHRKTSKWAVGFGGEPLKGKLADINKMFIEQAKERNFPIVYFSNLATLNDDLFNLLRDNAKYIHFIETTIDGVMEDHDRLRMVPNSFEKTVQNVHRLLEVGVQVTARTNIGPDNIKNISSLAEFYDTRGWFDMPNFKSIVARITDRHHSGSMIYTEDEAMSEWLRIKDQHPPVRKMYDYNIAYSLYNLLLATELRSVVDKVDFRIDTSPVIRHCPTNSGTEYVFTGKPGNAIYACAECAGIKKYRIGTHYPSLMIEPDKAAIWGNMKYVDLLRTIDTLTPCKSCIAATQCGGDCSLEAITEHGSANDVYCKDAVGVIRRFLAKESDRLYSSCRFLLDQTKHEKR